MSVYAGSTYTVTVASVIDGNTFSATFPDGVTRTCLLFGVDAPELVYASVTWPTAYESLDPSLQTQSYGATAKAALIASIISTTGSPSEVGVSLIVTVRIVSDTTVTVTGVNAEDDDIGTTMLSEGAGFLDADTAILVPTLFNIYQASETAAKNASLGVWTSEPEYPRVYRDAVDAAAREILYVCVTETYPDNGAVGVYLDDVLTITFDQEIEGSYATSQYFKFYLTNAAVTEYTQVSCTYSVTGQTVTVTPAEHLTSSSYYMLTIVGGVSGIRGVNDDRMDGNYALSFRSGTTIRPVSTEDPVITHVDIWTDADSSDDTVPEPYDLFSQTGTVVYSPTLLSTVPANYSVGVYDIASVIFTFDDSLDVGIAASALTGRSSQLPIDPNPLQLTAISITDVSVERNTATFSFTSLDAAATLNREFTFTLSPNVVRGVTKTGYDSERHIIRFTGALSPLYATPEQIAARLSGWIDDVSIGTTDYQLYKLIHAKSTYVDELIGPTDGSTSDLLLRNRLVICLVLYDMLIYGDMLGGGLKSRSLLSTKVEYYATDFGSIKDELDDCINSSLREAGVAASVVTSIKSGAWLNRHGKSYGVYR